MNRVDRLMGYLLLFQSRGLMRARDFADQFEVSERTVYRDIQALCEVGVPIIAMPGEGYQLMEGYYLPPITFSSEEARALSLAVSMLTGLTTGGQTQTAAASALEKIRAVLPQATLQQVEALQAIIRFYAFPGPMLDFDNVTFVRLQEAIHQRRVVHLRYHAQHTNQITERDVEPTELLFLDKAWLLAGYCRLRQTGRVFRLDRIDRLNLLSETFVPRTGGQEDRSPSLDGTEIVVCFEASIVRWVRERQHFSFVAEKQHPDGVIMIYRPRHFNKIESWLLSWGDKMELIAPASLRAEMAETAARMAANHRLRS